MYGESRYPLNYCMIKPMNNYCNVMFLYCIMNQMIFLLTIPDCRIKQMNCNLPFQDNADC